MARKVDPQIAASSIAFLVLAVGARVALEWLTLAPALRVVIVALPVAAFAWFLLAELRAIRACDEFQQRIQLEALGFAYPVAIVLVYAVGLFEAAELPVRGFENARDMWPLAVFPYFVGIWLARRRYE